MLTALRIDNFAIVASAEIAFGSGMTVLSGETGAGKSMLVHALKLVLGGRASPDVVRAGAERAEIEALFEVADDPRAQQRLQELGFPQDDELVIRRVVQAGGRSRATVNGRLTTATQLRALSAGLIDISSQHEHQTLVDPATHLETLDRWADVPELTTRMAQRYSALKQAHDELITLRSRVAARGDQEEWLRFQLTELQRVDPQPGELDGLQETLDRLRHVEQLRRAAARAEHALYAREGAICSELAELGAELDRASEHDEALKGYASRLDASLADLQDAADELGRYARGLSGDAEELAMREERFQELRRLAKRFGGDLDAAIAKRQALAEELAELDASDHTLDEREQAVAAALAEAGEAARALRASRERAADALATAIGAELADLGMGQARIEVSVAPLDSADAELAFEGSRLTATGADQVELLISPNPGEPPRPLGRIASGGELSRALLATKRVLAGQGPVGTYVFDEVDTGVGGAVAEAIGHKLREVAAHHQVLCITHLPQIAALGDTHYRVHKRVSEGRTHSELVSIRGKQRVEELARMLGGRKVSSAAREAAKALLDAA
ncbi:MAG: DNA repair protein RecN [Myxococcota bacterium]